MYIGHMKNDKNSINIHNEIQILCHIHYNHRESKFAFRKPKILKNSES